MGSGASSSSSVLDMTLALPTPEDSRNSAYGLQAAVHARLS